MIKISKNNLNICARELYKLVTTHQVFGMIVVVEAIPVVTNIYILEEARKIVEKLLNINAKIQSLLLDIRLNNVDLIPNYNQELESLSKLKEEYDEYLKVMVDLYIYNQDKYYTDDESFIDYTTLTPETVKINIEKLMSIEDQLDKNYQNTVVARHMKDFYEVN